MNVHLLGVLPDLQAPPVAQGCVGGCQVARHQRLRRLVESGTVQAPQVVLTGRLVLLPGLRAKVSCPVKANSERITCLERVCITNMSNIQPLV